jgi:hypothetical protein
VPKSRRDPFQVVVVRASLHDPATAQIVVEFNSVGQTPEDDRVLGRATTAEDAAAILGDWLRGLVEDGRGIAGVTDPVLDAPLTGTRRLRSGPPTNLLGRRQENGR